MDIPNHRSLHKQPVPRGGGLSIVILIVFCLLTLYVKDYLDVYDVIVLLTSLIITASIAFIDDLRPVSTIYRALVYCVSAACLVFLMSPDLNQFVKIFAVVCIVWMVNLYNFMDGIDGLASVEAITTSVFAVFIFHHIAADDLFFISLTIACSSAGFLVWNWSPAKIFMGDVGSCTLGLLFSIIALLAYQKYAVPISVWLVLLSVFIADTSFTLLKRLLTGEIWYQAHKDHAYQQLVEQGASHKSVTTGVLIINVLFLWPLSYIVYAYSQYSLIVVLLNYGILAIYWWHIQTRSLKMATKNG